MPRTRPVGPALLSILGAAALLALPTVDPPSTLMSSDEIVRWWEAGEPAAAMATLRFLALVGCAYVATLSLLWILADVLRLRWLRHALVRVATPGLRRHLSAGVLAVAMAATSTPAQAQSSGSDHSIVLVDVGPDRPATAPGPQTDPIVLTEVGPTEQQASSARPVHPLASSGGFTTVEQAPSPDSWLVEPEDHLWGIAERTLSARGLPTDDASVADYWVRLIDANRRLIGGDPDLIHPGQVVSLPPIGQG